MRSTFAEYVEGASRAPLFFYDGPCKRNVLCCKSFQVGYSSAFLASHTRKSFVTVSVVSRDQPKKGRGDINPGSFPSSSSQRDDGAHDSLPSMSEKPRDRQETT